MRNDKPAARPPARVLLADDHELARAGLRRMLEDESGIEVIGEAADGRTALELCRRLRPNLVLLDVRMPELDGLAAARAIKQELPEIYVVILTTHVSPEYLLAALQAGAAGYLLKDVTRQELLTTIRRVLRGESLLSGAIATRVLTQLSDARSAQGDLARRLTPREYEVLALVVEGLTNRQIASRLSLSSGTVKIHVEHIIAKLDVHDRTQAAVRAVAEGLVQPVPKE